MYINFFSFFVILFSMVIIDAVWLSVMLKKLYVPNIGHLLNDSMKLGPAIVFYILYAIGLQIFVVNPELKNGAGYLQLMGIGMLFGLVTYGTYDLTNQATLKNWPSILSISDMAWGACLAGIVSVISTWIISFFYPTGA